MRGSIVKRGNGYSYVLYLGRDNAGKKKQKWVGGFRTRREAERELVAALERQRTGTWSDAQGQTIATFLREWLASRKTAVRATTWASYEATLEGWVIPRIGGLQLDRLAPHDVANLTQELLREGRRDGSGGLSNRSVRYAQVILGHALKDAVGWGLISRNPAAVVEAPRVEREEMRVWSAAQSRTFLEHVAADPLRAMWLLLLLTGLRRGEALGLRWGDFDPTAQTLSIQRALVVVGYDVQLSQPKTSKGRRQVALDERVSAALGARRKLQCQHRDAAGTAWSPSEYVFTDELGRPLHPQRVTVVFKRLAKSAGLPSIRLHDLRHTAATLALSAGVHPKVVSERLGHANIGITLDTYSHVLASLHAEAADKVADLVFAAR